MPKELATHRKYSSSDLARACHAILSTRCGSYVYPAAKIKQNFTVHAQSNDDVLE